jgi:virginiamycin B lyase
MGARPTWANGGARISLREAARSTIIGNPRDLESKAMFRTLVMFAAGAVLLSGLAHGRRAADHGESLPDGAGKPIAAASCVSCHDVSRLATPGYDREGWQDVISRMMNIGATIEPANVPVLADYLARNFPRKPQSAPTLVAGNAQVSFREWAVATPGAFPHDPLATPDGAIWYTGQRASLLGRVDPKTGAIKEYRTRIPDSGPHGLVADAAGNIWFTANYAAYIGKLDPGTGTVTEYKMPDSRARDPHTPVFDQKGVLWFTVQAGNMIGRLTPRTGEVKLVAAPSARALPYGLVVNSKGIPFFAEFGTNQIANIDPNSMTIREYVLPNSGSRPRRVAITSDDVIWYSDYARGYLGRFDPNTGATQEWASPGGAGSQPYGITALNDIIWYSESGVQPNTLVRFDPRSRKFQTWPIPSGGGVVRNMMATQDGRLVLAESGAGKVALVDVK